MQDAYPSRRALLAGAGLTALAGCSTYGASDAPTPAAPPVAPPTSAAASGAAAAGGAPLATVADIPVGGGKIFAGRNVVVTQPQSGTIRAFSSTCTHAGCTVAAVSGGTITCPCHGSRFRIADGSVAGGPAPAPLAPVAINVTGGAIMLP